MSELEEKIKKELLKSGFPLQVFCQRCLVDKGWDILQSSEYYIRENELPKEIDIVGIHTDEIHNEMDIDYELFIECKKSEDNPWVFFKEEMTHVEIPVFYGRNAIREQLNDPDDTLSAIEGWHFNKVPSSSIYTTAFRKKGSGNQIFEAISSVLLSYRLRQDFLERHKQARSEEESAGTVKVSFLTILFDGKLYLADIEKDDSIDLIETNNISYCQKETKFPKFMSYTIDVIAKDYFSKYLDVLNNDRKLISEFYKQEISRRGA